MSSLESNQKAGKVYLVGAGPGDADVLTIKAAKAIAQASLILVDDLVSDAVLTHAHPSARIVHVGKRGGCQSTPQAFIEKLMVSEALKGETVLRLKGGDPMIFGRAGEEIEALQAAGLQVEIINGISAAQAAASALQKSLTHREHAHGVLFMTGHAKPGGEATDWAQIAKLANSAKLSLVIYMGMSSVPWIAQQLLTGLSAQTPVAIVQQASLPQERIVYCDLGALVHEIQTQQLASPSVLLIGDVFAAKSAWVDHESQVKALQQSAA